MWASSRAALRADTMKRRGRPTRRPVDNYRPGLLIGIFPADHVALSVVDNGTTSVRTRADAEGQKRSDTTDDADNHENDADGVQIDTVLIGIHGDSKVENCAHREHDQADDESTSHCNLLHIGLAHA